MTRVLVTGVSGEVGSRLAGRLATSDNVSSVTGVDTAPLAVAPPKLTFVSADVTSADEFSPLLQDADVVVHLLPPEQRNALQVVLDACNAAQVKQLVVASSTSVYGAWPDNDFPLLESSPLRPNPGFLPAVQFAEQERMVARTAAHTRVAVMRLATLMGTERRDRMVWDALLRVDWSTSRPMQFLHVEDAVGAFALAIERQLQGTFNVAADFVGASKARELCGMAPESPLPGWLGKPTDAITWRSRRYPQGFLAAGRYLEHPWVVSSEKLRSHGWKPGLTSGEALVASKGPAPWERLRPGQRRALVSNALFVAPAVGVGGATLAAARLWKKRNR